jgi:hypothetical protein
MKNLRRLINENKSSSEIAEALGRSRASVMTKKSEMGIRKRITRKKATLPVVYGKKGPQKHKTNDYSKNVVTPLTTLSIGQQIDAAIKTAKQQGLTLKISISNEN